MMKNLLLLVAFLSVCLVSKVAAEATGAMTVYTGAKIYTGDPEQLWVEAMAIEHGRIVEIGSDNQMDVYVRGGAQRVDLEEKLVIPGLNDNHVHVEYAARDLANYNCWFSQYSTLDEVISAVARCVKELKSGEWVVGSYWNSGLYDQIEYSSALSKLDQVSSENPVILRNDTTHDRWVNTRALEMAKITVDTKNPKNGVIGRDPKTGELNGLLFEQPAYGLVESLSPISNPVDEATAIERLEQGVEKLNSMGVTGFVEAKANLDTVRRYSTLEKRGELSARVALALLIEPGMSDEEIVELYEKAKKFDSELINTRFAKIFIDGVMVSQTAVFVEPYLPTDKHGSCFHGESKLEQEELNRIVKLLSAMGITIKLHTAGDGSVKMALDAIEAALPPKLSKDGPIHTLAHAGYIQDADMNRAAELNIALDASPTVWYPGPILEGTEAVIGMERAHEYWPMRTMQQRGVIVAGGSDWKTLPDEFSDIWSGIEGAVTRRNPTGKIDGVLNPSEALDVRSTITMYTRNTAKVMGLEKTTGTLGRGKSADFIVLDRNLFEILPDSISDTKVQQTYFEGRMIYESPD